MRRGSRFRLACVIMHCAVRRHRFPALPDKMDFGIGESREDLVRAGHVELVILGNNRKPILKVIACLPGCSANSSLLCAQ